MFFYSWIHTVLYYIALFFSFFVQCKKQEECVIKIWINFSISWKSTILPFGYLWFYFFIHFYGFTIVFLSFLREKRKWDLFYPDFTTFFRSKLELISPGCFCFLFFASYFNYLMDLILSFFLFYITKFHFLNA